MDWRILPESQRPVPFGALTDLAMMGVPVTVSRVVPRGMALLANRQPDGLGPSMLIVGDGAVTPAQQARLEYNNLLRRKFPARLREGCGFDAKTTWS